MQKYLLKNDGFSLAELVVVTAIFSIVFIVATNVLFNGFKGAIKGEATKEVRQNGDLVMNTLSRYLRESAAIVCDASVPLDSNVIIIGQDGTSREVKSLLEPSLNGMNRIKVTTLGATNVEEYLTSNKVQVVPGTFGFDCTRYAVYREVAIGGTFEHVPGSNPATLQNARPEEKVRMDFRTIVVPRQFE